MRRCLCTCDGKTDRQPDQQRLTKKEREMYHKTMLRCEARRIYSMLLALLCLCFVSLEWTQTDTISSTEFTTTGLNFQQNAKKLFSWMDSLILQDNNVTYPEFEQALLQYDTNKDGLLSVDETSAIMEKLLQLGSSSLSRTIFLVIDIRPIDSYLNRDEYKYMFTLLDTNSDGDIVLDEFVGRINTLHSLFPSTLLNSTGRT